MTVEELNDKQAEEQQRQSRLENRIYCCTAAGCISCGAESVKKAIEDQVKSTNREGKIEICGTGCMGLCSRGPLVRSEADDALYGEVTPLDAAALKIERVAGGLGHERCPGGIAPALRHISGVSGEPRRTVRGASRQSQSAGGRRKGPSSKKPPLRLVK